MHTRILDKVVSIVTFHQDNDLFVPGAFGSHADFWLGFILTTNDFLNNFDFFCFGG